jgi:hypothetical protein
MALWGFRWAEDVQLGWIDAAQLLVLAVAWQCRADALDVRLDAQWVDLLRQLDDGCARIGRFLGHRDLALAERLEHVARQGIG